VDRVGAGLGGELGRALGVFGRDAARRAELAAVDARPDREILARAGLGRTDDLAEEPRPVLAAPAVLVFAEVPGRGEELGEQIAVGCMELDGIEARPSGPLRGGRERVDDPGDVVPIRDLDLGLAGAGSGRGHQEADLLPREVVRHVVRALEARQRRHQHRAAFLDVDARDLAVVDHLQGDLRAVAMDAVGQRAQAGQVVVARDRELAVGRGAAGIGDGADLGDDQPDAAARPLLVVRDDRLARVSVLARDLDAHRRHRDAVAKTQGAERDGRIEMFEHGSASGRGA
jgi:hypothetical protein